MPMSSGIELATAYVSLVGETSKLKKDINSAFEEADKSSLRAGKKIGQNLDSGLSGTKSSAARAGADAAAAYEKTLKSQIRGERIGEAIGRPIGKGIGLGIKFGIAGAATAAAGAVGLLAQTMGKGFTRLKNIDNAKFKLQALGHSAADVKTIMDSATKSVKGTAFGLDAAANTAATAVAAGVNPGDDLALYLTTVADAAAIAGASMEDMGSIFNKVQTNGKAMTDDLQMLADRGLPIFTWLQKQYGVTGEALQKMVSDGKVSAADFQRAIAENIGGSAQKMGQSFEGAMQNLEAAQARAGANLLAAIFGGEGASALDGPVEAIEKITAKVDELGQWVNANRGEIHNFFVGMYDAAKSVADALASVGGFLAKHPGLIKDVAIAFGAWKAISGVTSLIATLGTLSGTLRNDLPSAANAGVVGINKAFALIALPAIGEMVNDQIQNWLKNNAPDLYELNNSYTPDQLGKSARDWVDSTIEMPKLQALPGTAPGVPFDPSALLPGGYTPYNPAAQSPLDVLVPRRATGGPIVGPGRKGKDSVLMWGAPGEHMLTADEVDALGGQAGAYALRAGIRAGVLPGFEEGGAIGVDPRIRAIDTAYQNSGKSYEYGSFDCSMYLSQVYAGMTGQPPGRYFTTDSDFEALGFKRGYKSGALNIGTNGGSGTGGHMAGTLPNGVNIENSSSGGSMYGDGAKGANAFSQQWYYEPPNSGDMGAMQAQSMNAGMPGMNVAPGMQATGGAGVDPASAGALGSGSSGRTEGYIPAAAGSTSTAGESLASGFIDMGAEAINGMIDQAASAAASAVSMGVTAGTMGAGAAGGPAAGAAAQMAIGMGTQAAKRGVQWGADMLGIGADSAAEILMPFGAPRLFNSDPTAFIPKLNTTPAAVTSAEQLSNGVDPNTTQHGQAAAAPPGPVPPQANLAAPNPDDLQPQIPGLNIGSINGMSPDDVVDALGRHQRLAALQFQGRP